ncbi:hypothetical protein WCD74_00255 [Actinomycetospora sp. OC33-EN08]|uniref:Uncharacterized protein n=1 Tax=Actinomycetospora aurantiaca TaxID=3129233 RepID=A0ABU8MGF2_9PSEU
MRLTRIAAATLIAGSLTFAGTGVALADTITPATAQSTQGSAAAQAEPGDLMLSATSVKPGQSVTFSGSVATPTTGSGAISVTSPAFAGGATMTRTDPTAFSGSATVASGVQPGTYTVTASSSAGTVSAKLTVVGAGPAPTPAHHGGTGTHTSGHGPASTETASTSTDTLSTITDTTGADLLPWALGGLGAIVLVGGGAYAIGRGRNADRRTEQAAEARQQYREPRTEVMHRR